MPGRGIPPPDAGLCLTSGLPGRSFPPASAPPRHGNVRLLLHAAGIGCTLRPNRDLLSGTRPAVALARARCFDPQYHPSRRRSERATRRRPRLRAVGRAVGRVGGCSDRCLGGRMPPRAGCGASFRSSAVRHRYRGDVRERVSGPGPHGRRRGAGARARSRPRRGLPARVGGLGGTARSGPFSGARTPRRAFGVRRPPARNGRADRRGSSCSRGRGRGGPAPRRRPGTRPPARPLRRSRPGAGCPRGRPRAPFGRRRGRRGSGGGRMDGVVHERAFRGRPQDRTTQDATLRPQIDAEPVAADEADEEGPAA